MPKPASQVDNVMDNIPYYDKWQLGEGIPIVKTFFVQDLKKVDLKPWARIGGSGAFINMEGAEGATGAYAREIPAGKQLNPMKHLYEDLHFVLKGCGGTTIWNGKGAKQTFEWHEGSLFALPLNCNYQHFNGSGDEPARFFSVNSAPIVFNLFHDEEFVFKTPRDFTDRFDGDPEYFSGKGKAYPGRVWDTNFIADARTFALEDWKERGAAGKNVMLEMANGSMAAHISEFPIGTYKKAHRHGPGFNVIIIKGKGFSLFWREGEPIKRYDWQGGMVFSPPDIVWHQAFKPRPGRAMSLPPPLGGIKYNLGESFGDI